MRVRQCAIPVSRARAVVAASGLLLVVAASPARAQPSLPTATTAQPVQYRGAVEAGRTLVGALMREANLPGLQVAVARGGQILWSEGFGTANLESAEPVTTLAKFRIGSLAKPLTAAAAVKLQQDGRLDLDGRVRRYVPSFPEKPHPITVRQLLGHLGGIRHYRDGEDQIRYNTYDSVEEALTIFEHDSLVHRPGSAYEYSSYGYVLASAAVAGAADRGFLSVMRDEVFGPLDMRHTVADHVDSIIPHRAEFYRESDEDGRLLNAPFTDNSYKWAAGGYLSTAEDLVRFASGLMAGELVRESLVDTMFASMVTSDGDTTGYGMGWRPRTDWTGRPVMRHGGSSIGGRAFLVLYPNERLSVAILVNASRAPVFAEEAQTLAHFFLDHPSSAERVGTSGDSLAGTYRIRIDRDGETISGTLHLTGSTLHPGWMEWEGGAAPVPLVLVDHHGGEVRLIGAGVHGMLNLWAEFEEGRFSGHWNWLGSTSDISGRRIPD